jgi:hypothetical protein
MFVLHDWFNPAYIHRVYWQNTLAGPFTQSGLPPKECSLARSFKPKNGATTLPTYSHPSRGVIVPSPSPLVVPAVLIHGHTKYSFSHLQAAAFVCHVRLWAVGWDTLSATVVSPAVCAAAAPARPLRHGSIASILAVARSCVLAAAPSSVVYYDSHYSR